MYICEYGSGGNPPRSSLVRRNVNRTTDEHGYESFNSASKREGTTYDKAHWVWGRSSWTVLHRSFFIVSAAASHPKHASASPVWIISRKKTKKARLDSHDASPLHAHPELQAKTANKFLRRANNRPDRHLASCTTCSSVGLSTKS